MQLELYENFAILAYARANPIFYENHSIILLGWRENNSMLHKPIGKTAVAAVLALSLLGTAPHIGQVQAAPAISVKLDDVALTFDAAPRIDKGVTYVPFRTVGEALGIQITWNSKTQTVKAIGEVKGQTTEVLLQVGSSSATVNGKKVKLAAPLSSGKAAF